MVRPPFRQLQSKGSPRSSETTSSFDPTVGLCPGPYGGPRDVKVFNERGTPVLPGSVLLLLAALLLSRLELSETNVYEPSI